MQAGPRLFYQTQTPFSMKKLLILFCFVAAFLATATQLSAQRNFEDEFLVDSLVNQETVIQEFPYTFKHPYYYSIFVRADSISGANAGTVLLQVTNDRAANTTRWSTLETLTIDGPGSTTALYQGLIYARRMRLHYSTPSGTRRVDLYSDSSFKSSK